MLGLCTVISVVTLKRGIPLSRLGFHMKPYVKKPRKCPYHPWLKEEGKGEDDRE